MRYLFFGHLDTKVTTAIGMHPSIISESCPLSQRHQNRRGAEAFYPVFFENALFPSLPSPHFFISFRRYCFDFCRSFSFCGISMKNGTTNRITTYTEVHVHIFCNKNIRLMQFLIFQFSLFTCTD